MSTLSYDSQVTSKCIQMGLIILDRFEFYLIKLFSKEVSSNLSKSIKPKWNSDLLKKVQVFFLEVSSCVVHANSTSEVKITYISSNT